MRRFFRSQAAAPLRLQLAAFALKISTQAPPRFAGPRAPLRMARVLIRSHAFGETVLSGTAGDGTVDPQAKPQFWPSP